MAYGRIANVEIINKGCWSKKEQKKFYCYEDGGFENGDLDENSKDDIASVNHISLKDKKKIEKIIEVDRVDNMLSERHIIPTIIKICTVSSDYETLLGCEMVCLKYKPVIIIELGTRPEDIIRVPDLLKKYNAEYKLFLRQKRIFGDSKTILYAV